MIAFVFEAALRGLVLAVLTGLTLRLFRVRNLPLQRVAWLLVLVASFAMPALMRVPGMPLTLPWLTQRAPAAAHENPPDRGLTLGAIVLPPAPVGAAGGRFVASNQVSPTPAHSRPAWTGGLDARLRRWLTILYLAVACALLGRLLWGTVVAWRIWNAAIPAEPRMSHIAGGQATVRISAAIEAPVTIGSGIVLPAACADWDEQTLRVVLAHEGEHVRNRDFYWQLLASAYVVVFWFSPLGWWLRRRICALAEAISDRAGLAHATNPPAYAEILLQFAAVPRQTITGVAMARPANISRRIERLLDEKLWRSAFHEGRRRAVAALLVLPCSIVLVSMAVRVPVASAAQARVPSAPVPPAAVPPTQQSAPAAPMAPVAPPEPMPAPAPAPPEPAPAPPPAGQNVSSTAQGISYSYGDSGDKNSFALVDGAGSSISFSGSSDGKMQGEIDKARHATGGKFLWFSHAGKSYVVTDPAILAQVEALYRPMTDFGREQETLGKQQEALGEKQARLAGMQARANTPTPDMKRELDDLHAAIEKLQASQGKSLTQEQLADIEGKLAEVQGRLGELQGKIGDRQGSYGAAQSQLGEQQSRLGEQQSRLGEQQARLARLAQQKIRTIIDEALRDGKAKPVE